MSLGIRKSKRIVRSVLPAEVFAFADSVIEAQRIPHDLRTILKKEVPLKAPTDSSPHFNIFITSICITARRLMSDLQLARQAFDRRDIA